MALVVKVLPVGSDVLTDLRPGRVRRTIYTERSPAITPLAALLIGLTAAPLLTGAGRALLGGNTRNEAKEKLEADLIQATIEQNKAKTDEIRGRLALIAREFDPTSQEERTLKLTALRDSIPLDLARSAVTLEAERANITREDQLFPLVMDARRLANENLEAIARERDQRTADFLASAAVAREKALAETARIEQATSQAALNEQLVREAIGPLDQAQAAQFLRERLFPVTKPERIGPIGALSVRGPVLVTAGF